jgi:hypothetical protein
MLKKIVGLLALFFGSVGITAMFLTIGAELFLKFDALKEFFLLEGKFLIILLIGIGISKCMLEGQTCKRYFGFCNVFLGLNFLFSSLIMVTSASFEGHQIMLIFMTGFIQLLIGLFFIKVLGKPSSKIIS